MERDIYASRRGRGSRMTSCHGSPVRVAALLALRDDDGSGKGGAELVPGQRGGGWGWLAAAHLSSFLRFFCPFCPLLVAAPATFFALSMAVFLTSLGFILLDHLCAIAGWGEASAAVTREGRGTGGACEGSANHSRQMAEARRGAGIQRRSSSAEAV